jgi:hypothetical protein
LQTRLTLDYAVGQLDVQLWCVFYEPFAHFHNHCHWHWQARAFRQARCQQLISEHSWMLWIIPELYYVEVLIRAAHKVPLRCSTHSSDVLHCGYTHSDTSRQETVSRRFRKTCFRLVSGCEATDVSQCPMGGRIPFCFDATARKMTLPS